MSCRQRLGVTAAHHPNQAPQAAAQQQPVPTSCWLRAVFHSLISSIVPKKSYFGVGKKARLLCHACYSTGGGPCLSAGTHAPTSRTVQMYCRRCPAPPVRHTPAPNRPGCCRWRLQGGQPVPKEDRQSGWQAPSAAPALAGMPRSASQQAPHPAHGLLQGSAPSSESKQPPSQSCSRPTTSVPPGGMVLPLPRTTDHTCEWAGGWAVR